MVKKRKSRESAAWIWILIIVAVIGVIIVVNGGFSLCSSTLSACDYKTSPPNCAGSLSEAKTFCSTLGSDCKPIQKEGTWKCRCPDPSCSGL